MGEMWGLRHCFLFLALATTGLAATGCSGARCSGVACRSGETCDPTDGRCKCGAQASGLGGTVCGPSETCDLNLQTCVGDLCATRLCSNGTTCDPSDGACKCGGAVCPPGVICDATSHRCGTGSPCADIVCSNGLSCDPVDRACKCHGALCGAGHICDPGGEGGCQPDPCYGVHCSGADEGIECIQGVCRCGRGNGDVRVSDPVCSRIEHCQDGACHAILGCDQIARCYGDELCSPIDLQCHCGSRLAAAPVCLPGEICQSYGGPNDPIFVGDAGAGYDGGDFFTCRAVNDCHQTTCSNGQICDPNQNFNCICETAPDQHGPGCQQNEYCIALDTTKEPVCTRSCNPYVQQECQLGGDAGLLTCYAELFGDGGTGAAICEAPNPLVNGSEGDPCGRNADCGPGQGCWGLPMHFDDGTEQIVWMCRPYCDTGRGTDGGTHDCLLPLTCTPVGQVQGIGEQIQIGFCL